jgi:hypothetical protein
VSCRSDYVILGVLKDILRILWCIVDDDANCSHVWKFIKILRGLLRARGRTSFGVHPAGTPGAVDGAARDRRLRQLTARPSAALARSLLIDAQ